MRSLFVATVLLISASPLAAQRFTVSPATIDFPASDDEQARTIRISNGGDRPTAFRMYFQDYEQGEDGSFVFLPAGSHPRSCMGRLHADPGTLVAGPRETAPVTVRVDPGESACWSILFVEHAATERGIGMAPRIGVRLYANHEGASEVSGSLRALNYHDDAFQVSIENTGDRILRLGGRLELYSTDGEKVREVRVDNFSVLSQRLRKIRVTPPAPLEPGHYTVIAVLDPGGSRWIGGRYEINVP